MKHYDRNDIDRLLTNLWERPVTTKEVDLVYHGYELGVAMSEIVDGE